MTLDEQADKMLSDSLCEAMEHANRYCKARDLETAKKYTDYAALIKNAQSRLASAPALVAQLECFHDALQQIERISGGLHPHYGPPAEERLADINDTATTTLAKP